MSQLQKWQRVRALIEKGWTQHYNAIDTEGRNVSVFDKYACRWCLAGAAMRVFATRQRPQEVGEALTVLESVITTKKPLHLRNIVEWNDVPKRTKAQVIALVDQVITRLSQQRQGG